MIECVRYTTYSKGSLLGYADFYVPKWGIILRGITLHQKNGHRWINFPAKEYTNKEGEKKYSHYIQFKEKEHFEAFTEQALKAIDEWCQDFGK